MSEVPLYCAGQPYATGTPVAACSPYCIRIEAMRESFKIILQCVDKMPVLKNYFAVYE